MKIKNDPLNPADLMSLIQCKILQPRPQTLQNHRKPYPNIYSEVDFLLPLLNILKYFFTGTHQCGPTSVPPLKRVYSALMPPSQESTIKMQRSCSYYCQKIQLPFSVNKGFVSLYRSRFHRYSGTTCIQSTYTWFIYWDS